MPVRINDLHGSSPVVGFFLAIIGRCFRCQGNDLDRLGHNESKNASNWLLSLSESALYFYVTSAACPAWRWMASCLVSDRPSCIRWLRVLSAHNGAVRI